MTLPKQRTIGGDVSLDGIGVHSGEASTLTFRPAEAGAGIRFRRMDLDGTPEIPADLDHVSSTDHGTTLASGDAKVLTVEHVLAAAAARGIDNLTVEVSGPEAPIRDGSFQDFFKALGDAGTVEQEEDARLIRVHGPLSVEGDEGQSYVAAPADGLRISATIDFEHDAIGRQFGAFDVSPEAFASEIAPARTFGFKADAEALYARDLAKGASLENTIVLDDDGVMNDALRFEDEFLRHKVGDLVAIWPCWVAGCRAISWHSDPVIQGT